MKKIINHTHNLLSSIITYSSLWYHATPRDLKNPHPISYNFHHGTEIEILVYPAGAKNISRSTSLCHDQK